MSGHKLRKCGAMMILGASVLDATGYWSHYINRWAEQIKISPCYFAVRLHRPALPLHVALSDCLYDCCHLDNIVDPSELTVWTRQMSLVAAPKKEDQTRLTGAPPQEIRRAGSL